MDEKAASAGTCIYMIYIYFIIFFSNWNSTEKKMREIWYCIIDSCMMVIQGLLEDQYLCIFIVLQSHRAWDKSIFYSFTSCDKSFGSCVYNWHSALMWASWYSVVTSQGPEQMLSFSCSPEFCCVFVCVCGKKKKRYFIEMNEFIKCKAISRPITKNGISNT